jgi:hypothetical protein
MNERYGRLVGYVHGRADRDQTDCKPYCLKPSNTERAQSNIYFVDNLNLTFLNGFEFKSNIRNVHCRKFELAGTLLKFSNVTH